MTNVKLDLLTDADIYKWIQDNNSGGISSVMKRYHRANNKYMTDFDKSKPTLYIMYLDANNLYGWAMSQHLPVGNYKMPKDVSEFTSEYILNIADDNERGYLKLIWN